MSTMFDHCIVRAGSSCTYCLFPDWLAVPMAARAHDDGIASAIAKLRARMKVLMPIVWKLRTANSALRDADRVRILPETGVKGGSKAKSRIERAKSKSDADSETKSKAEAKPKVQAEPKSKAGYKRAAWKRRRVHESDSESDDSDSTESQSDGDWME